MKRITAKVKNHQTMSLHEWHWDKGDGFSQYCRGYENHESHSPVPGLPIQFWSRIWFEPKISFVALLTSDTMGMMNPRLPVPKPTTPTLQQLPISMIIGPWAFKNFEMQSDKGQEHLQGSSRGEAQRTLALPEKSSPVASNNEETINTTLESRIVAQIMTAKLNQAKSISLT